LNDFKNLTGLTASVKPVCYSLNKAELKDDGRDYEQRTCKTAVTCKMFIPSGKELKMLKFNLLADWTPVNLEPATLKDIALITAMAFAAAGLIFLLLMIIFNLLFSYPTG
jgi:hypothetical protein